MSPLTLVELKDLWFLSKNMVRISELMNQFEIEEDYAFECIVAANHIWGNRPQLKKKVYGGKHGRWVRQHEEIWANYDPSKPLVRGLPPHKIIIPAVPPKPKEKFIRPKAEYTNTTPYGIAKTIHS
jgi:hypothetical protein